MRRERFGLFSITEARVTLGGGFFNRREDRLRGAGIQ